MNAAYDELIRVWKRLYRFDHLQAIAGWDRAAMTPAKRSDARADALAEMDGLLHRMRTDPKLTALLQNAEGESREDLERANLREMQREWRASNALPEALVEA